MAYTFNEQKACPLQKVARYSNTGKGRYVLIWLENRIYVNCSQNILAWRGVFLWYLICVIVSWSMQILHRSKLQQPKEGNSNQWSPLQRICYNVPHMLQLTTYAIWSKYYIWKAEGSSVRPVFLTMPRFTDCKVCILVSCWDQSLYLKTHDFEDVMQLEAWEPTRRTG